MNIGEKIELANTSTSSEILDKLSNDEDDWVHMVVAGNENTSVETLDKLANDENEVVRSLAMKHPNYRKK